ncbi:AT-rich interactive domain-containing protein 5B isoform X2 [Bombina bombina]|uniref:AT-rich interactive domain-containing protein 5B isoform X2 n=1 Tax=Bombina bombina TaxID=8345 RepID=UPI00235A88D7|nr:AT-rich interactive domain-containing protein 5B isoform X2 [Bombina bombina]
MAPNLKGRPRKKKLCLQRRDSVNGVKDPSNICDGKAVAKVKCEVKTTLPKSKTINSICKKTSTEEKTKSGAGDICKADESKAEEQVFLVALYKYMKQRRTPIERIPYLGFKQINLWTMFQAAQKLGGYETITARRQWKHIYDELGGNPGSTSAATCTRRHYERLILPYERFIKGEEDKPLPAVKPRKPDALEAETKTKVCGGTKRIKNETQKAKKEKDVTADSQDPTEIPLNDDSNLEEDGIHISNVCESEETKTSVDYCESTISEIKQPSSVEKEELDETISNDDHVKEDEHLLKDPIPNDSPTHVKEIDSSQADEQPQMSNETAQITKQEQNKQDFTDPLENETHDEQFNMFPTIQVQLQDELNIEDEKLPDMPDYIANCTVKVNPLGSEGLKNPLDSKLLQNALKQNPKVYLVQTLDMLKEKDTAISMNDDSSFTYTPLLYSRGNPGIMSPLAKKKLLSQVSGATLPGSYPYGSPPPLISKKKLSSKTETTSSSLQTHQLSNSESVPINRPSVIQHVQSFKQKSTEEKKPTNDSYKNNISNKTDSYRCEFSKHNQSLLAESYSLKASMHEMKDKNEKRVQQHSNMPSFFADFYSSPHLHRLYRQTEHHLHNEHSAKYHPRETIRDSENVSSLTLHKHQEKLHYQHSLHQHEKQNSCENTDDQPTDLSLPKSMHKHNTKMAASNVSHQMVPQESKTHHLFQVQNNKGVGIDCNPKACRVLPMSMSASKRNAESIHRPKSHNARLDHLRKMEGLVHPITVGKSGTQNFGTSRSLKRNLDDMDNPISEKKIRAVSPLNLPKEISVKETYTAQDGESSKSVHDIHSSSMMDSHKYPLSSHIFPGIYPGGLCGGLNSRIPTTYSHPLQYLKNQTVLSPLMQPLTLHSFMMQRQYLTNSTNSQQLYRHLASATPVGSSYGDLLHNSIYPLTPINPQSAFPSTQLSSVHPSTKL